MLYHSVLRVRLQLEQVSSDCFTQGHISVASLQKIPCEGLVEEMLFMRDDVVEY